MIRIPRSELTSIIMTNSAAVSAKDRDEMAIPSYLHPNPLVRSLMWWRYGAIESLMEASSEEPVLEFGCGVGLFLPTLCHGYSTVYATDLFLLYARKLAQERALTVAFIDSIEAVPDESLGSIIAADVLEHVDDLERYLALFNAKLKIGGELLVSGPTEGIAYRLGRFVAGFSGKGDYHNRDVYEIAATSGAFFDCVESVPLPFKLGPRLFEVYRFVRRSPGASTLATGVGVGVDPR